MTLQEQLYPLARRAFWGYFFVLLNFNFTFNDVLALPLLPNSLGWWLLAQVCREGGELRPSLGLLRPFCLGLAVWNVQQFFPALDAHIPAILSLTEGLVVLYTHFQVLTDLAALADEALPGTEQGGKLRSARTVLVVITTLGYCYDLLFRLPELAVVVLVAGLCVYLYILVQLWGLYKALSPAGPADFPPSAG